MKKHATRLGRKLFYFILKQELSTSPSTIFALKISDATSLVRLTDWLGGSILLYATSPQMTRIETRLKGNIERRPIHNYPLRSAPLDDGGRNSHLNRSLHWHSFLGNAHINCDEVSGIDNAPGLRPYAVGVWVMRLQQQIMVHQNAWLFCPQGGLPMYKASRGLYNLMHATLLVLLGSKRMLRSRFIFTEQQAKSN
ncbi:hypothetical protein PIB30_045200 [Stylosanthes scabra]|uniref:Uncharacterized protein n=1 Tax=Stylosanthes scabra TaxID=79078 RepID=A0ABU6QGC8_9FABA|nr:hypothetical protein [Stylosanthes scabra]